MPASIDDLKAALAGRYDIERELGRGGMATVYLARDVQHDRPVALKVLHSELAAALGVERFQREIKLAARLQHPHILSVYDSGTAADRLWFTMPFVEGESLRDRLTRERQLPVEDAVRLTSEVALALDYAHRHQILHRDIKPENILLTDGQALLADFGIARALGGSEENLTGTGVAIGTPGYMSPEQATGERSLDARSDIYALGSVLYEMLAGEPPFSGPTAQAVIMRIVTEAPRPLAATRSAVTPDLAEVVNRAMAKAPADRYTTAADFAQALGRAGGTMSGTTTAVAVPRRRVWGLVAVVILVAAGLGTWALRRSSSHGSGPRRIAVLPFENEGGPDDAYFAAGITDELRSKLSAVPGLEVTARASSSQYARTTKSVKEIGKDLDVEYILTGTVRWSKPAGGKSTVRVTPELVHVSSGANKFSQPYQAELSDVFKVQSDIAGEVVQALDVALATFTEQRLDARPTQNTQAHDAFLRGQQISQDLSVTDAGPMREAAAQYARAVGIDSSFAEAWAALALVHTDLEQTNLTVEGTALIKKATERALAADPNNSLARLARGRYLLIFEKDYERALAEYQAGLKTDPNNVRLLAAAASAEGTLGRWDDALAHARQAQRLDPRSITPNRRLAQLLHDTRHFEEARVASNNALALAPSNTQLIQLAAINFGSMGRLDSIWALIDRSLKITDTATLMVRFAKFQEMMWVWDPSYWPRFTTLTPKDFDGDRGHWGLKVGGTYRLMGDTVRARAYGDSARIAFEAKLKDFPEEAQLHELRGRALALAGVKDEAVREADLSLRLRETKLDASTGPYVRFQVARIFLRAGEYDRALDLIDELLKVNSTDLTPAWLRIDPSFLPLKGNPRFEKLIASQ